MRLYHPSESVLVALLPAGDDVALCLCHQLVVLLDIRRSPVKVKKENEIIAAKILFFADTGKFSRNNYSNSILRIVNMLITIMQTINVAIDWSIAFQKLSST